MGAIEVSVSAATSGRPDIIPASMDELARVYSDFILGMVRKAGIPDQEAADSVQYILGQLSAAKPNVIEQFDPQHVTEHQGRQVRTRFSTFLGRKVMLYCRGERGRVLRRASHELPIIDAAEGDGLSALFGPGRAGIWDDYSRLDAADFIALMRSHLVAIPPRSDRDTCDLVALFDELVTEVEQAGVCTYAGIQARFGISGTTTGAWLSRLRRELSLALGRPVAVIGGVCLSAEEIAWAVKILRETTDIRVAPPLAKAGHPLAKAEKGWYYLFSAVERKKFPSVEIPAGTHRKHAGHVQVAVIHRLERILAESAVPVSEVAVPVPVLPEPDPEPVTPEEEFECALWHGVRDAADLERVKALAKSVYAVSVL